MQPRQPLDGTQVHRRRALTPHPLRTEHCSLVQVDEAPPHQQRRPSTGVQSPLLS